MLSLRRPGRSPLTRAIARLLIAVLGASLVPASADASHVRPVLIPSWSFSSSSVVAAEPSKLTKTAFGELLGHSGTDVQPYAFTGEPYDPNVGFQYHRARWLNPGVGRFASMDPLLGDEEDPASLHRYFYARSEPLGRIDPSGESDQSLGSMLTTIAIQMVLFSIRHPHLTSALVAVGTTLLPVEVNDSMMIAGLPGPIPIGAVAQAEGRAIQLVKNSASRNVLRSEMGQISNAMGHAFEDLAKKHLFPNFDAAEIQTGTHVIDLFWRNVYIELKTARRLGPRERAQLAEFAAHAKATGNNLAYVFLIRPTEHTVDLIKKAGGYVYYLFD
jgi:RHS repeat-associated protein